MAPPKISDLLQFTPRPAPVSAVAGLSVVARRAGTHAQEANFSRSFFRFGAGYRLFGGDGYFQGQLLRFGVGGGVRANGPWGGVYAGVGTEFSVVSQLNFKELSDNDLKTMAASGVRLPKPGDVLVAPQVFVGARFLELVFLEASLKNPLVASGQLCVCWEPNVDLTIGLYGLPLNESAWTYSFAGRAVNVLKKHEWVNAGETMNPGGKQGIEFGAKLERSF